jgi:hypothetical protein
MFKSLLLSFVSSLSVPFFLHLLFVSNCVFMYCKFWKHIFFFNFYFVVCVIIFWSVVFSCSFHLSSCAFPRLYYLPFVLVFSTCESSQLFCWSLTKQAFRFFYSMQMFMCLVFNVKILNFFLKFPTSAHCVYVASTCFFSFFLFSLLILHVL